MNYRFLLAHLYVQSLQEKTTPKAVRLALKKLPQVRPEGSQDHQRTNSSQARQAYDISYEDTMERIRTQHPDSWALAKRVLGWIARAKRPLKTLELRTALAVELDEKVLDPDNMPAIEDMISVCAGLVTIDEQSNIVRLIHYTTQEFYERTWSTWFSETDVDICKTCLKYLSFQSIDWEFTNYTLAVDSAKVAGLEFYQYAAENWGYHCRHSHMDGDPSLLGFLASEDNVISESDEDNARYTLVAIFLLHLYGWRHTLAWSKQ